MFLLGFATNSLNPGFNCLGVNLGNPERRSNQHFSVERFLVRGVVEGDSVERSSPFARFSRCRLGYLFVLGFYLEICLSKSINTCRHRIEREQVYLVLLKSQMRLPGVTMAWLDYFLETIMGICTVKNVTVDSDVKNWMIICHLASFAGAFGMPIGNVIGPLVVWLIKKDESEEIDYHGKESINFQITLTIYMLISIVLCFLFIGFALVPAVLMFGTVFTIIATVKTNDGDRYRYPLSIRFLR